MYVRVAYKTSAECLAEISAQIVGNFGSASVATLDRVARLCRYTHQDFNDVMNAIYAEVRANDQEA